MCSLTQAHYSRLPLQVWDASWFYFLSDLEKLIWPYSKLVIHYAMIRGFHRAITTTYIPTLLHRLPSPFLNWFHLIFPKI